MTGRLTHLRRILRWGRTLARHGVLRQFETSPHAPPQLKRLARLARFGVSAPLRPRYREAFQELGPAAIKLGQALATRPDLVGEDAARELAGLQDRLSPFPFAQVCASIEEAFGRSVSDLFASIEETPVGSASIAQVHRAVTTDGRTVAVKVLRPHIEEDFERAIETYEWLAARIEMQGGEFARLRPRATIAYFRKWTERELNLRIEAASASELAENLAAEPGFIVPDVDWQRTARRVMTIEWIDGIKMTDTAAIEAAGLDRQALAGILVRGFLRQAIVNGFFHADLHQGNLFALPDGRIAAIDFGIMGRIDRRARLWLAEIIGGLVSGDYRRVAEIHFEAGYVPPHHNLDEFVTALRSVGEPIRGLPVKDISVGQMLDGLFSITRQFDMVTQPHLLLLQKTMVMVEGVAYALDPEVNMQTMAGPLIEEWGRDEMGPEAQLAERLIKDWRTILEFPDFMRRVMALVPEPGAAPPLPPLAPLPETRPWAPDRAGWLLLGTGIGAALAMGAALL
ncbi:2-polyprenylphenol 6-hydroxylase [Pacificimonas flava]|uniref:Ubiquinone biosynthesis monooxygenase UbiB n=1 Tax=Pacificimonas flava TaxID=1234595 RepID=M2U7B7_9SPHN|nr:2-polyprenylphenol 6-hydroxylase [Pacificimonas flava]EMD83902.1 Ubiquinone biosynthesis monooxygenase UbiB [Pacificimonas flava]MBB5281124.1 ubiquinone biosynthesis protein [Pacificimonas flava]